MTENSDINSTGGGGGVDSQSALGIGQWYFPYFLTVIAIWNWAVCHAMQGRIRYWGHGSDYTPGPSTCVLDSICSPCSYPWLRGGEGREGREGGGGSQTGPSGGRVVGR